MMRPAALIAALLAPLPALAHHGMDGTTPRSLTDGLISGLAHPVIGFDHLAFLIAAGLLAAMLPFRSALGAIALFVGAGVAGALLHLSGISLGPVEAVVAASSIVAGLIVLRAEPGRLRPGLVGLGFALAGLFHGHAFAEAVLGAEATPILAYLAGLALVQFAIAAVVAILARDAVRLRRLGGAAAAVVGAAALALSVMA